MTNCRTANNLGHVKPLLNLLEQRFDVRLESNSASHLRAVLDHYQEKREYLLRRFGEAVALSRPDYAKAVMISEAARMILREIDPRPLKKKKKKGISR